MVIIQLQKTLVRQDFFRFTSMSVSPPAAAFLFTAKEAVVAFLRVEVERLLLLLVAGITAVRNSRDKLVRN